MMTTRENWKKYEKTYFMPPTPCYDWVKKDCVDKAPIWCSVDLRDGNQALIEPMRNWSFFSFSLTLVLR